MWSNRKSAFFPDLDHITESVLPEGPLYVHFDADILDADAAPGFLYPVKDGPGAETMRSVIATLMNTGAGGGLLGVCIMGHIT